MASEAFPKNQVIAAVCLQLIGVVGTAAIGLFLQVRSYPSYLKKEKNGDIPKLFKFLLGNKVKVEDIPVRELDHVGRQQSDTKYNSAPDWFILKRQKGN